MTDESQRNVDVVGDNACAESVVGVVGTVNDLFKAFELVDALDGAEDL